MRVCFCLALFTRVPCKRHIRDLTCKWAFTNYNNERLQYFFKRTFKILKKNERLKYKKNEHLKYKNLYV